MQEKKLFEYAIIRVVPKVEREEFLNVGVILFCASQKFLQVKYELNRPRLLAFSEKLDIDEIQEYLLAFEAICKGGKAAGPIGELPIAERFRWLTANRSTIIQSSKVHPGLCTDAAEMLEKLYCEMVQC